MMKRKTAVIFGIIIAAQLCLTPYAGVKVQAAELEEGQMSTVSVMETLKLFQRRMRISSAKICRNLC